MATSAVRSARLSNFLKAVQDGKKTVTNTNEGKLLLEAICDQPDSARAVASLMSSGVARNALSNAMSMDLSLEFLNGIASQFIIYITDEVVRQLGNGQIFQDLLTTFMDVPLFWQAFQAAHGNKSLTTGIRAYASLVLSLLSLPPSLPFLSNLDVVTIAQNAVTPRAGIVNSQDQDIRTIGYQIQQALAITTQGLSASHSLRDQVGGRHDNDFADFRQIELCPTADELASKQTPFYLPYETVRDADRSIRPAMHLDNQFRLLREDMIHELREDLAIAQGRGKTNRRPVVLQQLKLWGMDCGQEGKSRSARLALRCFSKLADKMPADLDNRKKYLRQNPQIVKHEAFGCILACGEVLAFATIDRDVDKLAETPPTLLLHVLGDAALLRVLIAFKTERQADMRFVLVGTPFFAYEPVLKRLQTMASIPLAEQLLNLKGNHMPRQSELGLESLATEIETHQGQDLSSLLGLPKTVQLDKSQTASLNAALTQKVSVIQGPPGTGKSFVGALILKALFENTKEKILVLAFKNHALDQTLEDAMDMGIPEGTMVRLGSKFSPRTECLKIFEQRKNFTGGKLSREQWNLQKSFYEDVDDLARTTREESKSFAKWQVSNAEILEGLEFSCGEDLEYFEAFTVPAASDGMTRVGSNGKAVGPDYLIGRWLKGMDAGIFDEMATASHGAIWKMTKDSRNLKFRQWTREAIGDRAKVVATSTGRYGKANERLATFRGARDTALVQTKRIVGCTTTAAAKNTQLLSSINPGIIIVEEAGEVLESHILVSLSKATKQLILIGDHLQLRPKVNNFALTVDKNDGFDLDRSLFERLVVEGYPLSTLVKQHRMRPEISCLVRRLMYPDLQDDVKTLNRAKIRGLASDVIFFNHNHFEDDDSKNSAPDDGRKASRQNRFEADIVLKTVKYMAQQGYSTDDLVVLTPYLGQLRLLMDRLREEVEMAMDPVLSDIDSHDLVKAGLLTPAAAKVGQKKLTMSTIDNFQGEEGKIVIVSLTRANRRGDVGFMRSAQRLNVLLSRARDGIIIVGNAESFTSSKSASGVWKPFIAQLQENHQLFDGLPTKCEQHPDQTTLLKTAADFDEYCPDGGCTRPCPAILSCGQHACPSRCHSLSDHSKIACNYILHEKCPQNHTFTRRCSQKLKVCTKCEAEKKALDAKRKRDHALAEKREALEKEHRRKLQEIDERIREQQQLRKDQDEDRARRNLLAQRAHDLQQEYLLTQQHAAQAPASAPPKDRPNDPQDHATPTPTANAQNDPSTSVTEPIESSQSASTSKSKDTKDTKSGSPAEIDWQYQKDIEGAANEHIDALMQMIGLESIKQKVLNVKTKIETVLRQGASLKSERFGAVFLGNPGTGKTTVARLYAKCLASMGVVPGTEFKELTAARLMNGGTKFCEQTIQDVLNAGGGAIFIDEAYQLASAQSPGGRQVLDFLLPEVENHTGKILFILAGYNKEMEDLFAHNEGFRSRFPHELKFADYEDHELRKIFEHQVRARYKNPSMELEDGFDGLYARIVARRIGYARGRPGFGNARAVANQVAIVFERQANRLKTERRSGKRPNDFFTSKEDLIGPEPSVALANNKSWQKLGDLIGLKAVKESIGALLQTLQTNYENELQERPLISFNLNKVFLGSPGTGKTTVAKLYGQILADIGFLSNGEVIVKDPSDFIGDVIGASEKVTKGILAATVGKILVIDECYGLYSGASASTSSQNDVFRTAVIDTLVAGIQSVPGEDRCVLLLGYKDEMERMFQNVNPGLSRRFPLSEAFLFEDFSEAELHTILDSKLTQAGYTASVTALETAMDFLQRARNKPNFGNAGEVDILLNGAKARHQQRSMQSSSPIGMVFEPVDIDPDYDRLARASVNVLELFKNDIGREEIVKEMEAIQKLTKLYKARGKNPREAVPFNFVFSGPPGTGKTTTARKMGQIYYDMGFLATAEVIEVSATDLIGEYVGQTGPKTLKTFEKALGKVLFIDEAYRLGQGRFAKEAIDEIVDCLTKEAFMNRLVVILAGYQEQVDQLLAVNPGLMSRFQKTLQFRHLPATDCVELLMRKLRANDMLDVRAVDPGSATFVASLCAKFDKLQRLGSWANARDVETLCKKLVQRMMASADETASESILVHEGDVSAVVDVFISERQQRHLHNTSTDGGDSATLATAGIPQPDSDRTTNPPAVPASQVKTTTTAAPPDLSLGQGRVEAEDVFVGVRRDSGVSDEAWDALLVAQKAADEREEDYQDLSTKVQELEAKANEPDEESIDPPNVGPDDNDEERKRKLEESRIRRELARRKREVEAERLRRELAAKEVARKAEQEVQRKLRVVGLCVAGYRWIRQHDGYVCAGGSHYVSNAQLADMH